MFTLYRIDFCTVSKVAPVQCEQELKIFCCGVNIALVHTVRRYVHTVPVVKRSVTESVPGGSSEGCLKWGDGGSLRDLSNNILKQGVGKGKSCS